MKKMMGLATIVLFCFFGVAGAEMVDNGDGTVTDTATGLMWQQSTGNDGDVLTWEDALDYSENLSLAGHDDWRLPDRNELQSLVDYDRYDPAIDTVAFPGTQSSGYWSSTSNALSTVLAWRVNFDSGGVYGYGKPNSYYVRAVRGGQ